MTDVQEAAGVPTVSVNEHNDLYKKSYRVLRVVIGIMGISLPVALLLGDWLLLENGGAPRTSLSAYYHSPMRDVFVGILCVVGIFLITYHVVDYKWQNRLSSVAGVLALGVALFPTGAPAGQATALQKTLGEPTVAWVHFGCAVVFIVSLAAIGFIFGRLEKEDRHLRLFHYVCAATILLSLGYVGLTKLTGWADDYSLLIGEALAVLAFGVSWLVKGRPQQLMALAQPQ